MARPRFRTVFIVLCLLISGSAVSHTAEPAKRPASWAEKLDRPGLPNLHKLNDGLYREPQPTPDGIKQLEKLGIKTIVSLRANHSDKDLLRGTSFNYRPIPTNTWDLSDDKVVGFLQIATDKSLQPVFVHCEHGADRTGTMCAAYRVVVDGWTKQQAVDEMTKGGFGFHSIWRNLPRFVEKLDVEKIKRELDGVKKEANTGRKK